MSDGPLVVVFYREEHDVYARGCRVDRVESLFDMRFFRTAAELVEFVAAEAVEQPDSPMVAVVLRGWDDVTTVADSFPSGQTFSGGSNVVFVPCSSEDYHADYALEAALGKMVRERVGVIRQERSDAAVRELLAKKQADADAVRAAELKKLEELRAKYPDA